MLTPQVSHSISNTLLKFGKVKIGASVSFSLMSLKTLMASSVQTKELFFFKQSIMGAIELLKL